jgi:hypothetical protein
MKIISKKENNALFTQAWNDYRDREVTGIGYSLDIIEYYLITNAEFLVSDESFVVMGGAHDSVCLGICSFPIYSDKNYYYSTSISPLSSQKKCLKICFNHVDEIADKFQLKKIEFSIDTTYSQYGEWKYNFLRDYGYIDCTTNDYIFNLNDDSKSLFQKFNVSSRNILRKTLKNDDCDTLVYDNTSITKEVFLNYKKYHAICAGRKTRTDRSFSYMLDLIQNKKAILLEFNYTRKPVGYLIVFLIYPYAALSSIANLPEYERILPIYRMLYWKAIEYCANYKIMIYGFPAGSSLIDGFKSYMDKEQLAIAKYKEYMGGTCLPNFKGIKYYNYDAIDEDIKIFLKKMSENFYDK